MANDINDLPQITATNQSGIDFSILALAHDTCFVISKETPTRTQKQVYICSDVEQLKMIRDFLDKQITSLQLGEGKDFTHQS